MEVNTRGIMCCGERYFNKNISELFTLVITAYVMAYVVRDRPYT